MLDPSQIAKLITEDPDVVSEVVSMSGDQLGKIYDAATGDVSNSSNGGNAKGTFRQIYESLGDKREPASVKFVYRGMSNVEWAEAINRGYILSDCRFAPYENQENISCFGDYDDAVYYATELPIEKPEHINFEWRSESPREMPYTGIVVEVPRHLVDDYKDDPQVHKGEYWAKGPVPLDKITKVWEFTPRVEGGSVSFDKQRIK